MFPTQTRPESRQDNLGNALSDRRIMPIDGAAPPLPFEPALVMEDLFNFRNFGANEFGFGTHGWTGIASVAVENA